MARIVVVDDEPALLRLMQTFLSRQGHEVVCCGTGGEGIATVTAAPSEFQLAVLDHWLPDMSGTDLLHQVLAISSEIRVLVCSGSLLNLDGLGLEDLSRVGFLQKPYPPAKLVTAVDELLQR
jgi:DNA-binding response OmpR family regulator